MNDNDTVNKTCKVTHKVCIISYLYAPNMLLTRVSYSCYYLLPPLGQLYSYDDYSLDLVSPFSLSKHSIRDLTILLKSTNLFRKCSIANWYRPIFVSLP